MPVNPSYPARLCLVLSTVLCLSVYSFAQTLVGGSYYESQSTEFSTNNIWLQYANTFEFKEGMSIDTDFGQIFYTGNGKKRLNIRSTFKYSLLENLKIGAGMGFFWHYHTPELSQELRFNQVISYSKDFESGTMQHDLQIEERIFQTIGEGDRYKTRFRYRAGYTIPTEGPLYFGIYDEIFAQLNPEVTESLISMNRAGAFIGYNTFNFIRIEAHVMRQDTFAKSVGAVHQAWVFQLGIKHII